MKLDRLVHQSAGHLALADIVSVDESRTFDVMAIEDILMMTPNAWHLTDAQRCRAAALTRMTVTVSFRVVVFRQAGYQQEEHSLRARRAVGEQPRVTFLARAEAWAHSCDQDIS